MPISPVENAARTPPQTKTAWGRPLYYVAIGCSSLLLFLIQPVIAKAILPTFGGSAGVWVTAMLFFEGALLLGYLYSWLLTRCCGRRAQSAIHAALLLLSLTLLPVSPKLAGAASGAAHPVLSILLVLLASAGLPYILLSSTSPLLQSWYAASFEGAFPYRLFALSNAGSVLALIAYPFVVEPLLKTSTQLRCWSIAYAVLAPLIALLALRHGFVESVQDPSTASHKTHIPARRAALWIALAACGSALWLAVANHLSQEVAAVPFLWVLPLSLYLLSFILCFESSGWYRPALFRLLLPVAWAAACYSIARPAGIAWEIGAFSAALFVWCMFCHGELARTKPARPEDLTFFYLTIALGGALGGVFVGVVAPNVFSTYLELPVGIVASVLLALPLVYRITSPARLARLAVIALAAFAIATRFQAGPGEVLQTRNFYGALQVGDTGTGDRAFRSLYNGRTLHGIEFLAPGGNRLPTTYYGPESGVGRVLAGPGNNRRIAVVGLGAGTLATYGRAGDSFRFYEIDPAVIGIASRYFHFLDGSPARIRIVQGDGRLELAKEQPHSFDVIVLDAFSGDSIPVHLMTREAFSLYFRLLRPNGVLAIHLTNRYLDLEPVVRSLAASFQKDVEAVHSLAEPERGILDADWALVSAQQRSTQRKNEPKTRLAGLWTDDYSNLFQVMK